MVTRYENSNEKVSGTCEYICSIKEINTRTTHNIINYYEKNKNLCDSNKYNEELYLVKEFVRSSADQAFPLPSELRTTSALILTMNHLINRVAIQLPDDTQLQAVWYDFLFNRFRAVVKDITQQQLVNNDVCEIIEKMGRFYVYCHAFLDEDTIESYNRKANLSALASCIEMINKFNNFTSIYCYKSLSVIIEYKMYEMLLDFVNNVEIVSMLSTIPIYILRAEPIGWTIDLYNFYHSDRTFEYFSVLSGRFPYLVKCFIHEQSAHMRRSFVNKLRRSYIANADGIIRLPANTFSRSLGILNKNVLVDYMNRMVDSPYNLQMDDFVNIPLGMIDYNDIEKFGKLWLNDINLSGTNFNLSHVINIPALFITEPYINVFNSYDFCVGEYNEQKLIIYCEQLTPLAYIYEDELDNIETSDLNGRLYQNVILSGYDKNNDGMIIGNKSTIEFPNISTEHTPKPIIDPINVVYDTYGRIHDKSALLKDPNILIQLLEIRQGTVIYSSDRIGFSIKDVLLNPVTFNQIEHNLKNHNNKNDIEFGGFKLPIWQFNKNPLIAYCVGSSIDDYGCVVSDSNGLKYSVDQFLFDVTTSKLLTSSKNDSNGSHDNEVIVDTNGNNYPCDIIMKDPLIMEHLKASKYGTMAYNNLGKSRCITSLLKDQKFCNYFVEDNIENILQMSDTYLMDEKNNMYEKWQFIYNAYLYHILRRSTEPPVIFDSNRNSYPINQFLYHVGISLIFHNVMESFDIFSTDIGKSEFCPKASILKDNGHICDLSGTVTTGNEVYTLDRSHIQNSSISVHNTTNSNFDSYVSTSTLDYKDNSLPLANLRDNNGDQMNYWIKNDSTLEIKPDLFDVGTTSTRMNSDSNVPLDNSQSMIGPYSEINKGISHIIGFDKQNNFENTPTMDFPIHNLNSFSDVFTDKNDIPRSSTVSTQIFEHPINSEKIIPPDYINVEPFKKDTSLDSIIKTLAKSLMDIPCQLLGHSRMDIARHSKIKNHINEKKSIKKIEVDTIKLSNKIYKHIVGEVLGMLVRDVYCEITCHPIHNEDISDRIESKASKSNKKRKIIHDNLDNIWFKPIITDPKYNFYRVDLSAKTNYNLKSSTPWCMCTIIFDSLIHTPINQSHSPNTADAMHVIYLKMFHPEITSIDECLSIPYLSSNTSLYGKLNIGKCNEEEYYNSEITFDNNNGSDQFNINSKLTNDNNVICDHPSYPSMKFTVNLQALSVFDIQQWNEPTKRIIQNSSSIIFLLSDSIERVDNFYNETIKKINGLKPLETINCQFTPAIFLIVFGPRFLDMHSTCYDQYVNSMKANSQSLHSVCGNILELTCNNAFMIPKLVSIDASFFIQDFKRKILYPIHDLTGKYRYTHEWQQYVDEFIRNLINKYLAFIKNLLVEHMITCCNLSTNNCIYESILSTHDDKLMYCDQYRVLKSLCDYLKLISIPSLLHVTTPKIEDCHYEVNLFLKHYQQFWCIFTGCFTCGPILSSIKKEMVCNVSTQISDQQLYSIDYTPFYEELFPTILEIAFIRSISFEETNFNHLMAKPTDILINLPFDVIRATEQKSWSSNLINDFEESDIYVKNKQNLTLKLPKGSLTVQRLNKTQYVTEFIESELQKLFPSP